MEEHNTDELENLLEDETPLSSDDSEVEEDSSSEDDFDPEIDQLKRKAKSASKYQRYSYSLLAKMEKQQKEIEQLKAQYTASELQTMKLSAEKFQKEFDEAKAYVSIYSQEQDPVKYADAQVRLSEAVANKRQFEQNVAPLISQYEEYQESVPQSQPQGQDGLEQHQRASLQAWLEVNEDINPASPSHVPEMLQVVAKEASRLDQWCINQGRPDLIGSPEYQDELDNYVSKVRTVYYNATRQPPMAASSSNVLPVSSRSAAGGSNTSVKLSKTELDFIRENDLDINDFIKHKARRS